MTSCFGMEPNNAPPVVEEVFKHRWPWRITYTGAVDNLGRPHGFGFWKGDSLRGENFVGFWNEGIPSGPYKSREVATGSGFICLRVGWVSLRHNLMFGVSDVECSVSGAFFRGFPSVKCVGAPRRRNLPRESVFHQARRRVNRLLHLNPLPTLETAATVSSCDSVQQPSTDSEELSDGNGTQREKPWYRDALNWLLFELHPHVSLEYGLRQSSDAAIRNSATIGASHISG